VQHPRIWCFSLAFVIIAVLGAAPLKFYAVQTDAKCDVDTSSSTASPVQTREIENDVKRATSLRADIAKLEEQRRRVSEEVAKLELNAAALSRQQRQQEIRAECTNCDEERKASLTVAQLISKTVASSSRTGMKSESLRTAAAAEIAKAVSNQDRHTSEVTTGAASEESVAVNVNFHGTADAAGCGVSSDAHVLAAPGRTDRAVDEKHSKPRQVKGEGASRRAESVPIRPVAFAAPAHSSVLQRAPVILSGDEAEGTVDGELWVEFIARASKHLSGRCIEPDALFELFRSSDNLGDVLAAFAKLFHFATASQKQGGRRSTVNLQVSPPWDNCHRRQWRYPYEAIRVMLGGNWKAKQLWSTLDERCGRAEYVATPCGSGSRLFGRHCLIVGAGPCGLRTAIELRLLGARVTVVDQRTVFSRINQLHLWSWCLEELKQLGARTLEPPPKEFGSDPALLHIGISHLQTFLLKVALLLGVEILLGTRYVCSEWTGSCWRAMLGPAHPSANEGKVSTNSDVSAGTSLQASPSPGPPSCIDNIAVLVGAGGFSCDVGPKVGMVDLEAGLKDGSSIGLICNFARTYGQAERQLKSFNLAKQFYVALFKQLAQETGAELENIVYTKSHQSHYFVMTPTRRCLCEAGIALDDKQVPLLSASNIDKKKLDAFVRGIVAFPFKTGLSIHDALKKDSEGRAPAYADQGPGLFDFSKMKRSSEGLVFIEPPVHGATDHGSAGNDEKLLVTLVGDALVEPFWPEGLGISRGFFGVWDVCSAISDYASGEDQDAVVGRFRESYTQLKQVSASTKARVLHHEAEYRLAPSSRYRLYRTRPS
jgi:hypothetical protein